MTRPAFCFALASAALFLPQGAMACPPGQTSVMVPVGTGGGPDSVGGLLIRPVCQPDSSAASSSGTAATPEVPLMPLNSAIAWGNFADGRPAYFYTVARINSLGAMADAQAACVRSGVLNCRPGMTFADSWVAISRAGDGSYFAAHGRKRKDAQAAAIARCAKEASGCTVAETYRTDGRK
jgi:hypothetical protein